MFAAAVALAVALSPPPDCARRRPDGPPDPRCGDNLDGRPSPPDRSRSVAGVALAIPRVVTKAVFFPILTTSAFIERRAIPGRLRSLLTTDDGRVGVRPEIQYTSGFRPTGGLYVFYDRFAGPQSRATARARTAGPDILYTELVLRAPSRWGPELRGGWDRRNDRLFAGTGALSRAELEAMGRGISRYQSDIARAQLSWTPPSLGPLSFTLRSAVTLREYGAEGVRAGPSIATLYGAPADVCAARGLPTPCVDPLLVPGFNEERKVAYEGARVALDLREDARDGSGLSLAFDATYAHGLAGDRTQHLRLGFETVVAFGGIDRALLLRGLVAVVEPLRAGFVPFDDLVSPSGWTGMRGFQDGRFRDLSGLVGTIEYRWLIAHHLDASVFVDNGAVAGPWFDGLRLRSFFPSGGVGLRVFDVDQGRYWDKSVAYGVQFAYAPEAGVRFLLSASAF